MLDNLILWQSSTSFVLLHLCNFTETTFKLRLFHRIVQIRFDSSTKWQFASNSDVCANVWIAVLRRVLTIWKRRKSKRQERAFKLNSKWSKPSKSSKTWTQWINIKLSVYSSLDSFKFKFNENGIAMHFMKCLRALWSYTHFFLCSHPSMSFNYSWVGFSNLISSQS